ncbi:hypothetical protein K3495_g2897 [Podosphaera aphanis]|nr:hypothetical protein K3495_g2897 [Podosphaera aphanis]
MLNIYNAPPGSTGGNALETLYSLSLPFRGAFLMKGDFNLHHTRWQPSWIRSSSQGAVSFVEWADKNRLTLLSLSMKQPTPAATSSA